MTAVRSYLLLHIAGASLLIAAMPTFGANVLYSAEDIADEAGQDLWSYVYTVAGVGAGETLDITFEHAVHSPLGVLTSAPGWFTSIAPSDSSLGADGYLSLLNIDGEGALPGAFEVQVVRFLPGPVGAQTFELYDGLFNTLGLGVTAPVPEPAAWTSLLVGLGITVATVFRKRQVNSVR